MAWFEKLTGFRESDPNQVRDNITIDGDNMTFQPNGKTVAWGALETPALAELRSRTAKIQGNRGRLKLSEVVGDVRDLHTDPTNAGATFQVASQFNLLEMVGPSITPEQGVDRYEGDPTQGPVCAIVCGAGTIYRNYFVPLNGRVGQTSDNQIDCLADIGEALGNESNRLWTMKNGYCKPTQAGLKSIDEKLKAMDESQRDELRQPLRIGIQSNTQVTIEDCEHRVTQAYCSAMPVAYTRGLSSQQWEQFARLILEATYEACICAAIINAEITGNNKLFLTTVGGGAFGNNTQWIVDAIERVIHVYGEYDLDVVVVSYMRSNPAITKLL